jgi:hypothetical protein
MTISIFAQLNGIQKTFTVKESYANSIMEYFNSKNIFFVAVKS